MEKSNQREDQQNRPRPQSKTVNCYYCSGAGEVIKGMPCPNCQGKGVIVLTVRGLL